VIPHNLDEIEHVERASDVEADDCTGGHSGGSDYRTTSHLL
jgi:hypothetical protein